MRSIVAGPISPEWGQRESERLCSQYRNGHDDKTTAIRQMLPYLDQKLDYPYFVCHEEDRIRGLIAYDNMEEDGFSFVYIRNLGVDPLFQRQGIGKELLDSVKQITKTAILNNNVNEMAVSLFLKNGFFRIPGYDGDDIFKWPAIEAYNNNTAPHVLIHGGNQ